MLSPTETIDTTYQDENLENFSGQFNFDNQISTEQISNLEITKLTEVDYTNETIQHTEEQEEKSFKFNSLDEVKESLGIEKNENLLKVYTSPKGNILKGGGHEWIFRDEEGKEFSHTEAVKSSKLEQQNNKILDELYNSGVSINEFTTEKDGQQKTELHIYFADEKGHISYEIFQYLEVSVTFEEFDNKNFDESLDSSKLESFDSSPVEGANTKETPILIDLTKILETGNIIEEPAEEENIFRPPFFEITNQKQTIQSPTIIKQAPLEKSVTIKVPRNRADGALQHKNNNHFGAELRDIEPVLASPPKGDLLGRLAYLASKVDSSTSLINLTETIVSVLPLQNFTPEKNIAITQPLTEVVENNKPIEVTKNVATTNLLIKQSYRATSSNVVPIVIVNPLSKDAPLDHIKLQEELFEENEVVSLEDTRPKTESESFQITEVLKIVSASKNETTFAGMPESISALQKLEKNTESNILSIKTAEKPLIKSGQKPNEYKQTIPSKIQAPIPTNTAPKTIEKHTPMTILDIKAPEVGKNSKKPEPAQAKPITSLTPISQRVTHQAPSTSFNKEIAAAKALDTIKDRGITLHHGKIEQSMQITTAYESPIRIESPIASLQKTDNIEQRLPVQAQEMILPTIANVKNHQKETFDTSTPVEKTGQTLEKPLLAIKSTIPETKTLSIPKIIQYKAEAKTYSFLRILTEARPKEPLNQLLSKLPIPKQLNMEKSPTITITEPKIFPVVAIKNTEKVITSIEILKNAGAAAKFEIKVPRRKQLGIEPLLAPVPVKMSNNMSVTKASQQKTALSVAPRPLRLAKNVIDSIINKPEPTLALQEIELAQEAKPTAPIDALVKLIPNYKALSKRSQPANKTQKISNEGLPRRVSQAYITAEETVLQNNLPVNILQKAA